MLQLHGPNVENINDDVIKELLQLKKEGLVKSIGVNSFDDKVLSKILSAGIFDFVMLDYNILCKERELIIDRFYEKNIAVIAGAPLADSLYSNRVFKIRGMKDIWYLVRAIKNFRGKLIKGFSYRFVNNVDGITGAQIALRYVLNNKKISSAVLGTTSSEHLLENIKAEDAIIPEYILERIKTMR
jgi:aryl-alcohol dehydrogenase-like predicted oxidoreductase